MEATAKGPTFRITRLVGVTLNRVAGGSPSEEGHMKAEPGKMTDDGLYKETGKADRGEWHVPRPEGNMFQEPGVRAESLAGQQDQLWDPIRGCIKGQQRATSRLLQVPRTIEAAECREVQTGSQWMWEMKLTGLGKGWVRKPE
jgi:hypothetical protein